MDRFNILKKRQLNGDDYNYFFTPGIKMTLYSPKVFYVDEKYIVFEFDRKNANLYGMFKKKNEHILSVLRYQCTELIDKEIYNFYTEKENTFVVRVYLPRIKSRQMSYNIKAFNENHLEVAFYKPNKNVIYKSIDVEIKNLWQKKDTYGFNIELKSVFL